MNREPSDGGLGQSRSLTEDERPSQPLGMESISTDDEKANPVTGTTTSVPQYNGDSVDLKVASMVAEKKPDAFRGGTSKPDPGGAKYSFDWDACSDSGSYEVSQEITEANFGAANKAICVRSESEGQSNKNTTTGVNVPLDDGLDHPPDYYDHHDVEKAQEHQHQALAFLPRTRPSATEESIEVDSPKRDEQIRNYLEENNEVGNTATKWERPKEDDQFANYLDDNNNNNHNARAGACRSPVPPRLEPGAYAAAPGEPTVLRRANELPSSILNVTVEDEERAMHGSSRAVSPAMIGPNQPVRNGGGISSSRANLAVASMVSEKNYQIAEAVGGDAGSHHGNKAHKRTQRIAWIMLAALAVILVVIVVVLVSAIGKDKDNAIAPTVPTASISPTTSPSPTISSSPTAAPTAVPTLTPESYLMSLMPNYTVQTIESESLPHSLALEFLSTDPVMRNYSDTQLSQRYALATFYHATGGPSWTYAKDWLSHDVHECDWYFRKTFDPPTDEDGAITAPPCNEQMEFQHLWQWASKMVGTLPPELFWMTSLKSINLQRQSGLSGAVPSEIGLCSQLEFLSLADNGFSYLPSEMGLLTALKGFSLASGALFGLIPSEIGLMESLEALDLSRNHLTALPSELGQLKNMTQLLLSSNALSNSIPTQYASMSSLETLHLYDNIITGPLPRQLGHLTKLRTMILFNNGMSGTVPTELALLSHLEELQIYGNNITGTLPASVCALPNLTRPKIDCMKVICPMNCDCDCRDPLPFPDASTALTGGTTDVVPEFDMATSAPSLASSGADTTAPSATTPAPSPFEGASGGGMGTEPLPPTPAPSLFEGAMPYPEPESPAPTSGYDYFADDDALVLVPLPPPASPAPYPGATSVPLPPPPTNPPTSMPTAYPTTTWFDIPVEPTSPPSPMPPFSDNLPDFTQLALEDPNSPQSLALNWLQAHPSYIVFPSWRMEQLFALATFYFSYSGDDWDDAERTNWLSFDVDECQWGDTGADANGCDEEGRITRLALESQSDLVRGVTPPEVSLLSSLESLDITGMSLFTGLTQVLPSELSTLISLSQAHLNFNALTGTIPDFIGEFQQLTSLNIRSNMLSGTLPTVLGLLPNLRFLTLYNNFFTGRLPSELGLLSTLEALEVYSTDITGTVPDEICQLRHLTVLSVDCIKIICPADCACDCFDVL